MEFLEGETLARAAHARQAAARRGPPNRHPDRRCSRHGAQGRHHPSRFEARQRHAHQARGDVAGLRIGQAAPVALSAGVTQVATQQPLTGAGTLVGTLQYMAPEQLQGLPADARTDVFAFGCVLYEMVTGRRAFTGDTPASVIAAILEREPAPMAGGPDPIPVPVLDAIVRTCLAKNPDDRWWSAHDVGVALARLGRVAEPTAHPRRHGGRHGGPPSAGESRRCSSRPSSLCSTVLIGRLDDAFDGSAVKSVIDFPNLVLGAPNLSPDGRYVSMFAPSGDQEGRTVVVRRLDDGAVTWLAGTERAPPAIWSPDSRSVAFLRDGELKVADVATGGVRAIGKVPADVVTAPGTTRALSCSADRACGVCQRPMGISPTSIDPALKSAVSSCPRSSPTDERSSTPRTAATPSNGACSSGSLDSPTVTRLLPEPANAVISPRGYLLYGHQGTVFAQRFDLDHKRLVGDPVNLGSGADYFGPNTSFAVAGDLLVWANIQTPSANLTWLDRTGRILGSTPRPLNTSRSRWRLMSSASWRRSRRQIVLSLIELTRPIHTRLTPGNQSGSSIPSGRRTAARWPSCRRAACLRDELIRTAARPCSHRQSVVARRTGRMMDGS